MIHRAATQGAGTRRAAPGGLLTIQNKTGAPFSPFMSDVEGVRILIGTAWWNFSAGF